MILISHRGNTNGPNKVDENSPSYIERALQAGFDVEVDLWWSFPYGYRLGHDRGIYPVSLEWLQRPGIWAHAKDFRTFEKLLNDKLHTFFHFNDDCALTSRHYLWTTNISNGGNRSILMHADGKIKPGHFAGFCSDFISIIG